MTAIACSCLPATARLNPDLKYARWTREGGLARGGGDDESLQYPHRCLWPVAWLLASVAPPRSATVATVSAQCRLSWKIPGVSALFRVRIKLYICMHAGAAKIYIGGISEVKSHLQATVIMTVELEEPPYTQDNMQVVKDLLGGTVGGIAQVLVGQPFDTVKVRLQSAPEGTYLGAGDVIKKLVSTEGPKGFYKGTLTPLVGVGACVSVQFSVNEYMKRYYNQKLNGAPLLLGQFFNCGAAAGFANGFLTGPIEHIRIRLQTQVGNEFAGPINCAKKLYQAAGIAGIYKGLGPTLVRELIGLGMYFATYEALVNRETALYKVERADIPAWKLCAFGGLSGYVLWMSIYPVDVIKSKMQTDSIASPKFRNSMQVLRTVWATTGIRGFYKGFVPTILRAAPANGATFAAFEVTMRLLQ